MMLFAAIAAFAATNATAGGVSCRTLLLLAERSGDYPNLFPAR
jgi:hypothetical protein